MLWYRSHMLARAMVLCSLAGLFLELGSCTNQSCTEMGCLDSGTLSGEVTKPTGRVAVELCFNGVCQQATTDAAPSAGACVPISAGTVVASVCFQGDTPAGAQLLTGQLDLEHASLHDGDHFAITIRDAQTGAVLGLADQKVQYATDHPNGPDCPGECKIASLKVAPP